MMQGPTPVKWGRKEGAVSLENFAGGGVGVFR